MLPENSLGFARQNHHEKKQPKSRITVLVAANMDSSYKLPLLVIGKSKKPRAFKNMGVPVKYTANSKAWLTSDIFIKWLKSVDKSMKLENRKIAMIVDNCSAHPKADLANVDSFFRRTQLVFLSRWMAV